MDLERLEQTDTWSWRVRPEPGPPRAEAVLYGDAELLRTMDNKVLEQITNVARLPGLAGPAYAMPDAHWGYGFPIGGVAAFDPERGGIISAGGVGFDISCGIRCLRTDLDEPQVAPAIQKLADSLFRDIPAGVGVEGDLQLSVHELDAVLTGGAQWAVRQGYGDAEELEYVEQRGRMTGAVPANVSQLAKKRQRGEMGTLGSGNHYLEVQVVDRIHDAKAAEAYGLRSGQIVVSIHCGSRGLGHQIGTEFLLSLAKAAGRLGHRASRPRARLRAGPLPRGRAVHRRDERRHQLRAREPPDPRASHAPHFRALFPAVPCRDAVRRLAQHLQAGAARGQRQAQAPLGPPQGRNPRVRPGAPRDSGALPRSRPAGDHRRKHGNRLLRSRRSGHERGARVELGEPRRRARHEPAPGAQAMAGQASWSMRCASAASSSARARCAASPRKRRAPTRTSTALPRPPKARASRAASRFCGPIACVKG